MKKFISAIFPIIMMLIASVACAGIYMFFTNKFSFGSGEQPVTDNNQNLTANDTSVILSENELPRIGTSIATQSLALSIIKDFTQNNNVSDNLLYCFDVENGYQRLINGEIDVLITTEPSEEALSLAQSTGNEFDLQPIAKEGFVFYVNKNNPINSLKVSEVQQIYTGQITNWSQVGGNNSDIIPYQRVSESDVQKQMKSVVMKTLGLMNPPMENFYDKVYGNINDVPAIYNNSENAIGYGFYNESNVLYDFGDNIDNAVKVLKINDVEANYDNVHNGTYPFITNYYLVKLKNSGSETTTIFQDTLLSERGKRIIKEAGYIDN